MPAVHGHFPAFVSHPPHGPPELPVFTQKPLVFRKHKSLLESNTQALQASVFSQAASHA